MVSSSGIRGRIQKLITKYPTLRHVMVLLTGTAISQIVVMAVSTITARLFTPEAFGQFAVFASLTAIATTIASLRLDMTIMLPEDDDEGAVGDDVRELHRRHDDVCRDMAAVADHEHVAEPLVEDDLRGHP